MDTKAKPKKKQQSAASAAEESEEDKMSMPVLGEVSEEIVDRLAARLEEKLLKKMEASLASLNKPLKEEEFSSDEEMDFTPSQKNASKVEVDLKNKRSRNELEVLSQVLALAKEGGRSNVLAEIQLVVERRIFLLELADKWGWGLASAYAELYPSDVSGSPSKLAKAAEFHQFWLAHYKKAKRYEKEKGSAGKKVGSTKKKSDKGPGNCFRCGGGDHWAKDCPVVKKKKPED